MSVGKTANDGTISVFTKTGVMVYKEQDVLITCKGKPILIGVQDKRGQYQIPLMQQWGQWQPRRPSKQAQKALQQANSVYNLPSTKQAIKWMHTVCGYPIKTTWLKAIKASNCVGWTMLTERNIQKYYPKATEMAKGHLNQMQKTYALPKNDLSHSKHATPLNSMARMYAMYTPKRTRYTKPCSPTKRASFLHACNKATNTSW